MDIPILSARTEWKCPNCGAQDVTNVAGPHTRMHTCPQLGMMTAPMVPVGMDCKVIAREREDYLNPGEVVTRNADGRPIMTVETHRADGSADVIVFAPASVGKSEAFEVGS